MQQELSRVKDHLLGRQGEIEELESQLSESKAETQDMEVKYADLASQMEELQQKLTSEVLATAITSFLSILSFTEVV